MTRTHLLKLIQLGLCLALALSHLTLDKRLRAQQPPPNAVWEPAPSIGTCSRCGNWRWTDALGQPCQSFTCLGPGWPTCADQVTNSHICTPGEQFNVTECAVTGVETCSYTCNAQGTGYGAPTCQAIGNGGNFRRTFCDYNAGCPVGNGYAQGRPTTVSALCTQNGTLQTVTYGACGTDGCNRRPALPHTR